MAQDPKERTKFSEEFRVRISETDRKLRLQPVALFNFFLESAIRHSESLGRGPEDLHKRETNWFLLRIHVRVRRYPRRNEHVRVQTWPWRMKGVYAIREFHMVDEHGETCAEGTSQWAMIDMKRRRPIRLPDWILSAYEMVAERRIDDSFEKLPAVDRHDLRHEFRVRLSDLDANQHATSASYFDWCLEAVPTKVHDDLVPVSIEIHFKKEANYRELLEVRTATLAPASEGEQSFSHAIVRAADSTLLALARSRWGQESGS